MRLVAFLLAGLASYAFANNLPQNPDFSAFNLWAICPQQTWTALSSTAYVVTGEAYLFVNKTNTTSAGRLKFNISPGIPNSATFYAHVHNGACANSGGGHFQANTSNSADTSDLNEYWFNFVQSGDGSVNTTSFSIDNWNPNLTFNNKAVSIVIHYPSTKIACCDLKFVRKYATCGAFTGYNGYTSVNGNAAIYTTSDGKWTAGVLNNTILDTYGNGFIDNAAHAAHVHNTSCSVNTGGAHWKYNTSSTDGTTFNEFWWTYAGTGSGNNVSNWQSISTNNNISFDGLVKSVVVHAPNGTKAACCDLSLENTTASYDNDLATNYNYDMIAYCPSQLFNNIDQNTYSITGSAFLYVDSTNSKSRGVLNYVSYPALTKDIALVAHVHMDTCANGGGDHWKYDSSITGTISTNEFWFSPQYTPNQPTDNSSSHTATTISPVKLNKTPKSIMIHQNGNKFSCCDLRYVTQFAYASPAVWTSLDSKVAVKGDARVYIADSLDSTAGDLNLQIFPGNADNAYFEVHVHNQSCASGSGAHWKYDPSYTGSQIINNEVWWTYNGTGDGTNTEGEYSIQMNNENFGPYTSQFASVVIHAPKALGSKKLACADLTLTSFATSITPSPGPTVTPTRSPTLAPTLAASREDKSIGGKVAAGVLVPVAVIAVALFFWQRRKNGGTNTKASTANVATAAADDNEDID